MKWVTTKILKLAVKLFFLVNKDCYCFHIGTKHPDYDYTIKKNIYEN